MMKSDKHQSNGRKASLAVVALAAVALSAPVGAARTDSRDEHDSQWLTYNKDYSSQRYIALDQINTGNVARIGPVCKADLRDAGAYQSGLLVIDGVIYVTTTNSTVALRADNCRILWQNIYTMKKPPMIAVNRGVAYLDGMVYRGMPDGYMQGIDAKTGKTKWEIQAGDASVGEYLSSAPIAWRGLVFTGLAGSDAGIRGRVMAFDAKTGKQVWVFHTIPMGKEPGAETWKIPQTAQHGGGGQWTSYTLDPQSGELFVPVANPSPDFSATTRPGDNLYTNSIIVLDAMTGKLKWYRQFLAADDKDYDVSAAPALYQARDGRPRLVAGSKDGYLYGVDRTSHELVFKTPVTTIGEIRKPDGVYSCPGWYGGVEWNGPAIDPQAHVAYVGSVDWCANYQHAQIAEPWKPGQFYNGTGTRNMPGDSGKGWVSALDTDTGKILWRYPVSTMVVAGVTATAGGLVFTGDAHGNFFALEAKTGKLLYRQDTGGSIGGGVISYQVGGKQYVAVATGDVRHSGLAASATPPMVIVYGLAPPAVPSSTKVQVDVMRKLLAAVPAEQHGKYLYGQFCAICHNIDGTGYMGPDLTKIGDPLPVATFVKAPQTPMPKLFPAVLTEQDVQDVAHYVAAFKNGKNASDGGTAPKK